MLVVLVVLVVVVVVVMLTVVMSWCELVGGVMVVGGVGHALGADLFGEEALLRQSVEERIDGRVEIAEPERDVEGHVAHAVLANGHDEEDGEVGQKADGEADHDRRQLLERLLLLVHEAAILGDCGARGRCGRCRRGHGNGRIVHAELARVLRVLFDERRVASSSRLLHTIDGRAVGHCVHRRVSLAVARRRLERDVVADAHRVLTARTSALRRRCCCCFWTLLRGCLAIGAIWLVVVVVVVLLLA